MSHSLAWGSSCFLPLEQMFVHILGLYLVGFKDSRWYFCEVSSSPRPDCFPPSVLWRNLLPFPGRLIWVCFVAAEGEEEAELGRGTAVPWRIPPGWVPPSCCPAAAGEGFRLWNCIPLLKKKWSEAAADLSTSIFPRYQDGKVAFPSIWSWSCSGCPRATSTACGTQLGVTAKPVPHSLVSLPGLTPCPCHPQRCWAAPAPSPAPAHTTLIFILLYFLSYPSDLKGRKANDRWFWYLLLLIVKGEALWDEHHCFVCIYLWLLSHSLLDLCL